DLDRRPTRSFDLNCEPTRRIVEQKAAAAAAVERISFAPGRPLDIDVHEAPRADQVVWNHSWRATGIGGTKRADCQCRHQECVLTADFQGGNLAAASPSTASRRLGYVVRTLWNAAVASACSPSASSNSPRSSSNGLADQGG